MAAGLLASRHGSRSPRTRCTARAAPLPGVRGLRLRLRHEPRRGPATGAMRCACSRSPNG
eukprot:6253078-Lingulodinium_polyedra.AAC.1